MRTTAVLRAGTRGARLPFPPPPRRGFLFSPTLLLNKAKIKPTPGGTGGFLAHNGDLPVIFRLRVIRAKGIITSCLPGRKCPTAAACTPACLPAPSPGNACNAPSPATPKTCCPPRHPQTPKSGGITTWGCHECHGVERHGEKKRCSPPPRSAKRSDARGEERVEEGVRKSPAAIGNTA